MLSNKFVKQGLSGFMAIWSDYLLAVALLYSFPSFVAVSGINVFSKFFTVVPVEFIIPLVLILLFSMFGSYKSNYSSIGRISTKRPIVALGLVYVSLLILISYSEPDNYSYPKYLLKILILICIYALLISFVRLLIHLVFTMMLKLNWFSHNVLLVFHNVPDSPYLKEILRYVELNNLTLMGYCGTEKLHDDVALNLICLGKFKEAPQVIKDNKIDEVIILSHTKKIRDTEKILTDINNDDILIRIVPGTLESISGQYGSRQLTEIPIISIRPRSLSVWASLLKRVFDLLVATFGLAVTLLFVPYIAWRIKRSSPGSVIFKQERIGKNGRPFILYKFRTMYSNAEVNGPRLACKDDDNRITDIGLFLRRNHLDELPQFWNIIKGDMSLVGPRPERQFFASQIEKEVPYYHFITQVKPGLTSLAMVKYGYAHSVNEMTERILYDIIYLNNQSFIADLQIIGNTIVYVLKKMFFREVKSQQPPPKTIDINLPVSEEVK